MLRLIPSGSVARRAFAYIVIFSAVFFALNILTWKAYITYKNYKQGVSVAALNPAGVLVEKAAYYKERGAQYNAVFFGDSRTLCGMHPDVIDPLWGRKSYNLSHWATWMPSQYALISDMAPFIPKDTVVVWSVGHQNFTRSSVHTVYPPGWARGARMAFMGLNPGELLSAQLSFTNYLSLIGWSDEYFFKITEYMAMPLWTRANAAPSASSAAPVSSAPADPGVQKMKRIESDPQTSFAEPWFDDSGKIASVAQYKLNGAMLRTEIIPSFYRAKQAEQRQGGKMATLEGFGAGEAEMILFRDILGVFKKYGLTVVVHEFEEAPYIYQTPAEQGKYREWMRTHVKPVVEEYGFKYIHADEAQLTDADYFDYNHLNDRGVRKHNAVLARKLKALER